MAEPRLRLFFAAPRTMYTHTMAIVCLSVLPGRLLLCAEPKDMKAVG